MSSYVITMCHVMLCYITRVMLCYITYVMLCYITYVMLSFDYVSCYVTCRVVI